MPNNPKIIVRFPPSPTGFLQMGNVRTLIYNYLFARKNNGVFLLRIEDTDKERSKKEYEELIFDDIKWLGLNYDNKENVWRSSERTEIYKQKIQDLIKNGSAYISQETEGENREVVRFKNPGGKIKFHDLIRGEIEIDVSDLGDFIIARNINDPIYHLAVSVDDAEAGITHIIRGDDHISNTPRQILIIEALGGKRPVYVHLPMVLAPDKTKLSKRKHGESVSLKYYRDKEYKPEAIINFLAMIGWNPGTDQEIFSLEELVKIFDISKVQKKGGIFNVEKLNWINKEYMKSQKDETEKMIAEKIKQKFGTEEIHPKLIETIFERIEVVSDVDELIERGELDYFFNKPELDKEKISWKNQSKEDARSIMEKVLSIMEEKDYEKIKKEIWDLTEKAHSTSSGQAGRGEVLWPLRYALSGKEKSPDPFALIEILGVEESKKRIQNAIQIL